VAVMARINADKKYAEAKAKNKGMAGTRETSATDQRHCRSTRGGSVSVVSRALA
jgi:hypothetical protein